jgi:rhomboid protease GluP
MNDPNLHPLAAILTACAAAAPSPWYPSALAQTSGIPRERLDALLDDLRLGGLVRLTDWTPGQGQGYALTREGEQMLHNPRLLEKLCANGVPRRLVPPVLVPAGPGMLTSTWERGEQVRAVLLNPARSVVTQAIFLVNVLFFLAGLAWVLHARHPINEYIAGSDSEAINATGAVSIYQVLDGQWWRLLTSIFVHIGLLHICVNMYALFIFGPIVERMFGHWRFLLLYLVAGFGGSCVGVLFQYACAGASGAICGLLGAFGTWTYLNRHFLPPSLVRAWMRNVMINTVLLVLISLTPRISWSGHLGGAVFGIVAAGLLNYQMVTRGWLRWLALAAVLALPLLSYSLLLRFTKPEIRLDYEQSKIAQAEIEAWKLHTQDLLPLWQSKARRKSVTRDQAEQLLSRIDPVLTQLQEAARSLHDLKPTLPEKLHYRAEALRASLEMWIGILEKSQTVLRKSDG